MRLRPPVKKPDPLERLLEQLDQPSSPSRSISLLRHCQAAPLGVLVWGVMEWLLGDEAFEEVFQEHAADQYTRDLTISALVGLLMQVSAGLRRSVHAAYKADQAAPEPTIPTTYQAVYGKLGRMNPEASASLVRFGAKRFQPLLERLPAAADPLPGYRLRVLDGNVLTGTDHRLKPLRGFLNACLPGKSLVVYEPATKLVTDLVLCEDAYTQERALLTDVLPRVQPQDLLVADRNFCTTRFVFGVAAPQGFFLVRDHARSLPWEELSPLKKRGTTETGTVYEQKVRVTDPDSGQVLELRRLEMHLLEKTRDGDHIIALLTNVPCDISAQKLAELYRARWTIETHFQFLTQSLHCEVPGLGKPRAALFMFAMSLLAGNALAVVRASLRQAHGAEAEAEVSGYYLADEIGRQITGLELYAPDEDWSAWRTLTPQVLAPLLTELARRVNLKLLTRCRRGPKKPPAEKRIYDKKHKHFATARILDNSC